MVGENLFGNGFLCSAAEFDFGILIDSNTTYFSLSILLLGATLETLLSCRRIFCFLVRTEFGKLHSNMSWNRNSHFRVFPFPVKETPGTSGNVKTWVFLGILVWRVEKNNNKFKT